MSKKLKAVESNIQPNHKEAELWVTHTNNDGSKEVKYWNSKAQQWSKCEGEGNGGDVEAAAEYYRIDWDKAIELGYDENDKTNLIVMGMKSSIAISRQVKAILHGFSLIAPYGYITLVLETKSVKYMEFYPISLYDPEQGWLHIDNFKKFIESTGINFHPDFQNLFIPCTKEEFYSLT